MYSLHAKTKKMNVFSYIYLATLFVSFHTYLIVYISSSFLEKFVSTDSIGIIYAVASTINVIAFLNISKILERFGNRKTIIAIGIIEVCALSLIAFSHNPFLIIFAFTLHQAINPIIMLGLDDFLESASDDGKTGYIRGIFNTLISVTAVISPVIVGSLLIESNFSLIYLLSASFLIPFIYIVIRHFKRLKDDTYHRIHLSGGIAEMWNNKNIRNIYIANLLLQIFYSWVVIYVPIYLNTVIGFNWQELGLMIGIALLPFVLLEIPVGTIADKKLGEKELLVSGFIILIIGLCAITIENGKDFAIWTAILFFTRVGASIIEITTESYFFKQINPNNQNYISIFRTTWPIGYIIGPIIGSFVLLFMDQRFMFVPLALLMFIGIRSALLIKDTK